MPYLCHIGKFIRKGFKNENSRRIQREDFFHEKNIYMDGECVGRDDPKLLPAINTVCLTYDAQTDPDEKIRDLVRELAGIKKA